MKNTILKLAVLMLLPIISSCSGPKSIFGSIDSRSEFNDLLKESIIKMKKCKKTECSDDEQPVLYSLSDSGSYGSAGAPRIFYSIDTFNDKQDLIVEINKLEEKSIIDKPAAKLFINENYMQYRNALIAKKLGDSRAQDFVNKFSRTLPKGDEKDLVEYQVSRIKINDIRKHFCAPSKYLAPGAGQLYSCERVNNK